MTALAPALQAYFTERLITQRSSSPETIAAYRDAFRLLLRFAHQQTGKQPFELDIDDLDAPLIGSFLKHLEEDRGNSPRTRNARLGAIHSFYRFAALERHTNAMLLRAKGVDIATIALWLGHESTQTTHIYEHADPALKEQAIARTAPLGAKPGRYRPATRSLHSLRTSDYVEHATVIGRADQDKSGASSRSST